MCEQLCNVNNDTNSNTTFVKVKSNQVGMAGILSSNSNTTFVKVKYGFYRKS
mgnify:CR=1 FL=1